jgi:phosphoglycolate phosphatase
MITAIFDLDGTLADTIADLGDAVNFGLEKLGFPTHDYTAYKQMVGNGVRKLCYRALPEDSKDRLDELHGLFKEYYDVHYLDKTKLYDGIKESLARLRDSGVKLAVATNKPENVAAEIVMELLPEFDFVRILGGNDKRPAKPDTAILIEIFAALPDEENRVFMIGDSNVDIQTATMGQILLQLQNSYQVQMSIQNMLEGALNPSGRAFMVELNS